MQEPVLATPALSEGLMLWRTQKHLMALAASGSPTSSNSR
jgi:hypothetical protein